jgi:NTE family protein
MPDVLARQKDIQYSSRTRLVTDYYSQQHRQNLLLRRLLDKVPEAALNEEEERALKQQLADLPEIAILHLIYQQAAYEGQAKDHELSAESMGDHWESGYGDTMQTLNRKDWLTMPAADGGLVIHDVHRGED